MKKKLLFGFVALVIFVKILIFLGLCCLVVSSLFPVQFYGIFNSHDEEWMVGKTVSEVFERYGLFDHRDYLGFSGAYRLSNVYHVYLAVHVKGSCYDPNAVVTSVEVVNEFENYKEEYKDVLYFENWCRGKTLGEIVAKAGAPQYCISDSSAVLYKTIGIHWYVLIYLDGSYDSPQAVAISFEHPVKYEDSWQPWSSNHEFAYP